jgi:hypothetical protein
MPDQQPCSWRRKAAQSAAIAALIALAGCNATPADTAAPVAPLPSGGGGTIVLFPPEVEIALDAPSPPWWRRVEDDRAAALRLTDIGGRAVLQVDAPGGALLGRRIDIPLSQASRLRWAWYLEPGHFSGGPGDGLDRGLRLVVGFDSVTSSGIGVSGGLPPHDRSVEIVLGGVGAPRSGLASTSLYVVSDKGIRRTLKPASGDRLGRWQIEELDLVRLYTSYWPNQPADRAAIRFIAMGGLTGPIPADTAQTAGYISEILLQR